MKPIIAISVNYQEDDIVARSTGFGTPAQTFDYVAIDYSRAIERQGGIPLWIPTMLDEKNVAALLDKCDGVLLSGGHDVDPMRYGEFNKYSGLISPKRDEQDLFIAQYALKKGMNVLGICRGSQILNVACGGTLYQDVEKAGFRRHSDSSYPRNYGWHEVKIEEGSLLADIFGKTELWINSYHHKAVKDPGKKVKVIAKAPDDGTIEGFQIEGKSKFALGVQWHPEMMYDNEDMKKIFKAFVKACAAK